jgi:uncharacterized protein (TIGR04141 family)
MQIRGKFLFFQVILYLFIFFLSFPCDSSNHPRIDQIGYHEEHPNEFTLFKLKLNRIADIDRRNYPERYRDIDLYLSSELFKENVVWDDSEINDSITKKVHLHEEEGYTCIALNTLKPKKRSEVFTDFMMGVGSKDQIKEFEFCGSLLIFLQSPEEALAYGFGNWKSVINKKMIVPMWGLRTAASIDIFSGNGNIKTIKQKNIRHSNPSSCTEKKTKLAPLKNFMLEVGSGGIEEIQVITNLSKRHTCTGKDFFKFMIGTPEVKGKGQSPEETRNQLKDIALYLDGASKEIHPNFKPYIDTEIVDTTLIQELNREIRNHFNPQSEIIFPHESVWSSYGNSPLFKLREKEDRNLLDVINQEEISLTSEVTIKKNRHKQVYNEPLSQLIFSAPMKYDDHYYRFDRSQWFVVDESRFGAIANILRGKVIPSESLNLPSYGSETLKGDSYQEANYNINAVEYMNRQGLTAVLLDRQNVQLAGKGNQFEFSDILKIENANTNDFIDIIHVKRAKVKNLSHLDMQVQRCAEFLGSNLNRKKIRPFVESLSLENHLTSEGLLKSSVVEKIRIILAVIDDRENKNKTLFKKQDLWGLDRTRQVVEQYGFNFGVTVIPETGHENAEYEIFGHFEPNPIENISIIEEPESGIENVTDEWSRLRNDLLEKKRSSSYKIFAKELGVNSNTLRSFLESQTKKSPTIKKAYEAKYGAD